MNGEYKDTFDVINQMAMVKMAMNRHKGNIENNETSAIIEMLRAEVEELSQATKEPDILHIIEEAADVMNFLVAVTHQQIERYRGRKEND